MDLCIEIGCSIRISKVPALTDCVRGYPLTAIGLCWSCTHNAISDLLGPSTVDCYSLGIITRNARVQNGDISQVLEVTRCADFTHSRSTSVCITAGRISGGLSLLVIFASV